MITDQKTHIAIIGLGISGMASLDYFVKNKNYQIYLFDENQEKINKITAEKKSDKIINLNINDWNFDKIKYAISSPGIPPENKIIKLLNKNKINIICDIEVLFQDKNPDSEIIAITGTNGKSTTTALIYYILKQNNIDCEIGGNYGIPALSLDLQKKQIYVIEVSSYQLDLLDKADFDTSLLLNITPDHLDRYKTLENYIKSKQRVFNKNKINIICEDSELNNKIKNNNLIKYSINENKYNQFKFDNLPGDHNKQNIVASFLVCQKYIKNDEDILNAIKTFSPLSHRMEKIFDSETLTIINDSKATNAEATAPALNTYNNIIWLAGGVQKEGGISSLKQYYRKINHAIFYGKNGADFADEFKKTNNNYSLENNLKTAINKLPELIKNKSNNNKLIILLSPCAASFDEFKNFEQRGDYFKKEILKTMKLTLSS